MADWTGQNKAQLVEAAKGFGLELTMSMSKGEMTTKLNHALAQYVNNSQTSDTEIVQPPQRATRPPCCANCGALLADPNFNDHFADGVAFSCIERGGWWNRDDGGAISGTGYDDLPDVDDDDPECVGDAVEVEPGAPASVEDAKVDAVMHQWKTGEGDPAPAPSRDLLPTTSRWQQMAGMAQVLSGSALVRKRGYATQADAMVILLAAHDLGIATTLAIQKIHVIEGKASMSAELMAALVQREGHELWPEEVGPDRVVACGRRAGSDRIARVTWTMEMAQRSNLAGKDNWKHYPQAMLWARAVSQLCRMMFADVLCGMTYTPDELGAITDADGEVIDVNVVGESDPADRELTAEEASEYHDRARALPLDLRNGLNNKWRQWTAKGNLRRFSELRTIDIPKVETLFKEFEDRATLQEVETIEEAEVVEPEKPIDLLGCEQDTCETCGLVPPDHEEGCPERPFAEATTEVE